MNVVPTQSRFKRCSRSWSSCKLAVYHSRWRWTQEQLIRWFLNPHSAQQSHNETQSFESTVEIVYLRRCTTSQTTQRLHTLRWPMCSPSPLGCGRWWPEALGEELAPLYSTQLEKDTHRFKVNQTHWPPTLEQCLVQGWVGKNSAVWSYPASTSRCLSPIFQGTTSTLCHQTQHQRKTG